MHFLKSKVAGALFKTVFISFIILTQVFLSTPAKAAAPIAQFAADINSGGAPLNVSFVDVSTENPTSWLWDFGDGSTSTAQNPEHAYTSGGSYTVKLTVSNADGSDSEEKSNYISVIKANFSASKTSGPVSLAVTFTSSSEGTVSSYRWDFNNDGVVDSTAANPTYTYTAGGIYTVSLRVSGPAGTSTRTASNYITVYAPPVADFSATPTSGKADLAVNFTDLSTGNPTAWEWDFNGDGTVDSTSKNPSYTYTSGGNFKVSLKVTGPGRTDTKTKDAYISVIKANFSALPTSGSAPLTVNFTDTSEGTVTARQWDFNNDGVVDSTAQNPSHNFTAGGKYTVTLRVIGPVGTSTRTITSCINVLQPPTADFSGSVLTGNAPLTVNFTDMSTGNPTAWQWSFGDGGTSTEQDPSHTYAAGGDYTVTLTATNADGSDSETKAAYIRVLKTEFSGSPTSGVLPLIVNFTDQSEGTITSWRWDFNSDGVPDSTAQNPSYTYTTTGNFTVSLRISGPGGSDIETKANLISTGAIPVSADFSANPSSGVAPLTVAFTDMSIGNPTAWQWDFDNDGIVDSTAQNPSYTFSTAGTYTVKLTASKTGSTDSITKTITATLRPAGGGAAGLVTAEGFASALSGTMPLAVAFTDLSGGSPNAWLWEFGDGSSSTEQNPTHTYTSPGAYQVMLTVTKGTAQDSKVIGIIKVWPVPPAKRIPAEKVAAESPLIEIAEIGTATPAVVSLNKTDIYEMLIQVKQSLSQVLFRVQQTYQKPDWITASPAQTAYTYFSIDYTMPAGSTEKVTINFKMSKQLIQSNRIDESTVTLNRYNEPQGKFDALPTSKTDEDATSSYFTATTPALSIFVVTAASLPAPTASPTPTPTPTVSPTPTPPVSPTPTIQPTPTPVPPTGARFQVSNLDISPVRAAIGGAVAISVLVDNTGGSAGTYDVKLLVNGKSEAVQSVTLGAGEKKTVTFTVVRDTLGAYEVKVDNLVGSFEVFESAVSWLWVWVGIIIAVVAAVVVWLLARRRHARRPA